MTKPRIEEALERVWTAEEEAGMVKTDALNERFGVESANKLLNEMNVEGLIKFDDERISLTHTGRKQAAMIIRRHRLAERLLHDVLEIHNDKFESIACQFEHYIGDDVVSSICTLLGHPNKCPHGKEIPKGDCCLQAKKDIKSIIIPLSDTRAGDSGRVVYIATHFHNRLDRISGIGILPGIELKVHQKLPTFIVQVGESQIALDNDIAKDIYIRRKHH